MNFEKQHQDEESLQENQEKETGLNQEGAADHNEILRLNINTLIELFQTSDYRLSTDASVVEVGRVIQKHTTNVEGGHNQIGDPEAFLNDLHTARDKMLERAGNTTEKEHIQEVFSRVDIPGL